MGIVSISTIRRSILKLERLWHRKYAQCSSLNSIAERLRTRQRLPRSDMRTHQHITSERCLHLTLDM